MKKTNSTKILCRPAFGTLTNNIGTIRQKEELNKTKIPGKENGVNFAKINKPAEKNTLLRKIERRYLNASEENLLDKTIFEDESQQEYIESLFSEELKYILQGNFIEQTVLTVHTRYMVLNWMFKIQQYLKIEENEFYLAINIFDSTLHTCADFDEATLLAITSLWVVHKFTNNAVHIPASELIPWLNKKYSKKDIATTERKILSIINFAIWRPEPSIFLHHFLRKIKHEKSEIYFGSFFVCDCISMFPKFSSVQASFIAALSLYTSLVVLKRDTQQFLNSVKNIYNEELLKGSCKSCLKKISQIRQNEHQEPFGKYSSLKRMNIAEYFKKCEEVLNTLEN
ncbi:hypothetical protein WA026_017353 [Henosepilachna vigintioctopunctata]|uniref:Uncharacterized protein n=1 Tax=Henosepilachna vigintioctopunctata TaxID=420089 RepID=A0AAW1VB08_9CUCU